MHTAAEIKKAIIEKSVVKARPVEKAELLGVEAWLFRVSSYDMEGWREISNDKDPLKRKLGPAKLVQISFRDETGAPVFQELELPILAGLDDGQINPLFKRILAINGYGNEGVGEILKNLVAIAGIDGVWGALSGMGFPCPSCTSDSAPTSSASGTSPSIIGPLATPPKTGGPGSSA